MIEGRPAPMRRAVAAAVTLAALFMIGTLAFGAPSELSGGGVETGIAACYSRRLRGHRTSSGKRYNPNALTAAHPTIPIGTQVRVTNVENGLSSVVTVNDRLSKHVGGGIIIDISQRACRELKFPRTGEAKVKLAVLGPAGSAGSH